jgi:protein-S-isoprenylcysteine O-methyltransferase Ste14
MHMQVKALVGAGDRIGALTLPFAIVGLAANILWPSVFRMGFGAAGMILGIVFVAIGVPLWLTSAVQVLAFVPKGKLITGGPFALMLHPLYTSVALLVIPGCGLLFDTWLGFAVGIILYGSARLFAPSEERDLAARFPQDYPAYRKRVILPWL